MTARKVTKYVSDRNHQCGEPPSAVRQHLFHQAADECHRKRNARGPDKGFDGGHEQLHVSRRRSRIHLKGPRGHAGHGDQVIRESIPRPRQALPDGERDECRQTDRVQAPVSHAPQHEPHGQRCGQVVAVRLILHGQAEPDHGAEEQARRPGRGASRTASTPTSWPSPRRDAGFRDSRTGRSRRRRAQRE